MSKKIQIKCVMVLYTGGTIGMKKDSNGAYVPVPNLLFEKLKSTPQLHDPELARLHFPNIKVNQLVLPISIENQFLLYDFKEYKSIFDSSNITPENWISIVEDIQVNYDKFDGIVILHGTDTMAYTASAISFMLEGVRKPIIITGSQVPIFEPPTDAISNLLSSLTIAGFFEVPEVCIIFNNKLFRGNRTTKAHLDKFDAFVTPNHDVLGTTEINVKLNRHLFWKSDVSRFRAFLDLNTNVQLLIVLPTINAQQVENVLKEPTKGLVIESYGSGNIPIEHTGILEVLKKAIKRKVIIVNITQCLYGTVSPDYHPGAILDEIGVIPGYDMTREAALTKLYVVLGYSDMTYEKRVQLMRQSIRGEITISCSCDNYNEITISNQ